MESKNISNLFQKYFNSKFKRTFLTYKDINNKKFMIYIILKKFTKK